ncbi:MAG: NAD(P)H-dependent oxidoreductase subunit E [Armatimonadetes bacterium]|nr:NAD(P)H-dependent oxidoreductase subunit E [Armatimonadota bacterium]
MPSNSNVRMQCPIASEIDLSFVDSIVERLGTSPSAAIPILQAIQKQYRYLPEEAMRRVCEISEITPSAIIGVASFYSKFRHKPVGRHLVSVCHGTACHVKGAELVHDALRRQLGIADDDDTDPDGVFTVQKVVCLGCCTLAPAMQIDGVTYGHLTHDTVGNALHDFLELERRGLVAKRFDLPNQHIKGLAEIRIGMGSCCIAGGSADVRAALEQAVNELAIPAAVKPVGCVGMCHQTPMVEIAGTNNDGSTAIYAKVDPADARGIVRKHFKPGGILRRIKAAFSSGLDNILTDESWAPVTRYAIDVRDEPVCAFLGRQKHIATELCGQIDPLDLDEYIELGGFEALRKCVTTGKPEEVIDIVKRSGLRGRGGAGFPTGNKWQLTRAVKSDVKYVICNGDEGDPGAFMDRMILESYPYRVLEGMAIAAFAVGANEGYLYIRAGYPLAVKRIRDAIERCKKRGLLGDKVFGSHFSLKLRIMEGAGAFVCGEESALIASIEGKRGMPRLRPPYPAESGLWGKPTNVNNVETYSLMPYIVKNGAEAFAKFGTMTSKGTKVFALAGKVTRGGLIEVPMGISVREIVEEIGGGVPGGRKFKAVQIGGPSGGCIPAEMADTAVDYEALTSAGAIMGSGGLVVLDDQDCMVDIARYFLEFTQHESCGKCTFCRVGTRRMLDILDRLCTGHGKHGDLETLENLAHMVKRGSLCGLGQTAPNPVLSTLHYFRDEYKAHLEGKCPAGRCKALIKYSVTDDCIGCTKCAQHCPVQAISMTPFEKHEIDQEKCIRCDTCMQVCPVDSIRVE